VGAFVLQQFGLNEFEMKTRLTEVTPQQVRHFLLPVPTRAAQRQEEESNEPSQFMLRPASCRVAFMRSASIMHSDKRFRCSPRRNPVNPVPLVCLHKLFRGHIHSQLSPASKISLFSVPLHGGLLSLLRHHNSVNTHTIYSTTWSQSNWLKASW